MIAIQLDIWGNVTSVSDGNGPWSFRQSFLGDKLISYEDNLGNYWAEEYGNFNFKLIRFKISDEFIYIDSVNNLVRINVKSYEDEIIYTLCNALFPSPTYLAGSLVSLDLVPVQSMSYPSSSSSSNLFYLDYRYKKTWYQKIKNKINLVMSKFYRIFVSTFKNLRI